MTVKKLSCICCPAGCGICVEREGGQILSVTGNACPRGEDHVRTELTVPVRTLTTTVRVRGSGNPVVPVRTLGQIPRERMGECLAALHALVLEAPVAMGQRVLENVAGTGIPVVATRNVDAGT